jgi:hypothetical protein
MALISIMTGGESLDGWKTAKFHVFVARAANHSEEPVFLWAAAKSHMPGIKQIRRGSSIPPFRHINGRLVDTGRWSEGLYDIDNDTILQVYATRPVGPGKVQRNASTFLVVRDNAPYQSILMPTTGHPQGNVREAFIQGNFDILPFADALSRGVKVSRDKAYFYLPSAFREVCSVVVREHAKVQAPLVVEEKIVNTSGAEVVIQREEPGRKLLLS